jgi:putative ABC transport system permease protein
MLSRVRSLFRNLFRRRRVERDLDDELAAFEELSPVERAATRDEVRAARAGALVEQFGQDLRHGARMLLRSPGFTAVAVATLALGIGANTAIFSVVDGVLLRPAPVEDLDGLVMVWETDRHSGTTREPGSLPDFLDLRARSRSFAALAAVMAGEVNLAVGAAPPRRVAGLEVTEDLLPMLGVRPILGRGLTAEDARPGGPRVVLISEGLWREAFAASPDVVGRTLRLDEVSHEIAGVVGDDTDFGVPQILSAAAYARSFADRGDRGDVDVWAPLVPDPERLPRTTHPLFVLGRLLPDRSLADARAELAGVAAELERAYPENDGRGVFVEPLADVVFAPVRPALRLLLATVFLVLLIASVNVANLLLARGASRAREVAVRSALGATRGRLTRQFLVENLLLTTTAAAVGVGLAYLGLDALLALAPRDVPRLTSASVDLRVLGFTLVTSLIVGLVFGLVPSLQARRVDVQAALKAEGGALTPSATRRRLGAALVVVELGLAVLLVTGASLLVRSFWKLGGVDPGFRADGVLKAEYQLPAARYPADFASWPDFQEMHAFTRALLARVSALPGVTSAAIAADHPLAPGFTNSFVVVGREAEARSWPEISVRRVTPGYLATAGLPLLAGRALDASDTTAGEPVLLVNQAAAERFFPGGDPIGARIRLWGADRRVVGVVGNERFQGLAKAAPVAVYTPLSQTPSVDGGGVLLVRAARDPAALAAAVRAAVHGLDAGLAVFGVETLDRTLARSVAQRRFVMLLLVLFAALAVGLAAVGVHGTLAYGVAQRTKEIGIRMALGARRGAVLGEVLARGLALAAAGVVLGVAGAAALAHLLRRLLFGVEPTDAATLLFVSALLLVVALAASWFPARAATRVEPMRALRGD